jgi:hypothetical protein
METFVVPVVNVDGLEKHPRKLEIETTVRKALASFARPFNVKFFSVMARQPTWHWEVFNLEDGTSAKDARSAVREAIQDLL